MPSADLDARLAIQPRGDTRDLADGTIAVPGTPLRSVPVSPPEINARIRRHRQRDVLELGLRRCALLRAGDRGITPAFPARSFHRRVGATPGADRTLERRLLDQRSQP